MDILREEKSAQYCCSKNFSYEYFTPISRFVHLKIEQNIWDDYNELYHAVNLVEKLKMEPGIWFDTHWIVQDENITGVMVIVGGNIKTLEKKYVIENENDSLLLKYFHIVDKGKGYGSFWLGSVIIPYYKSKGYRNIYVNSSHEKSFPFYKRFGSVIATYERMSDNGLFKREGNSFLIRI